MGSTFDAQRNELSAYVLREDETPFGLTLGNFKTFATSTPKGGIRGLWDADSDQIIFGAHQIAYRAGDGETLFPHQITREFTFLPYAQIAEFGIARDLHVTEAFYVPHGPRHDRVVSFVVDVTVHNAGTVPARVQIFPWALLIGQRFYGEPEKQVRASAGDRFIRSFGEESGWVRWWGGSRTPHAVVVAPREQPLLKAMMDGGLGGGEHLGEVTPQLAELASSRIFGAFEYRVDVPPGAREPLRLAVVFHKDGDDRSKPVLEQLLRDPDALPATERYYAEKLADARLLTPSPLVNRGVVWAKTNMLRVVKEYPQGWGSTNSPPSDILVSRDTSWFVHGYDYFLPQFSRDAIELFNRNLEPSGQVVEYVRGVNGYKTSYELNVNDDTPLHIIAVLHHYNATLDDPWLREVFPLVRKIADYMLTQRDANGLLFCKAAGVDMFGITSWRNIIPYYTLDGAVTEINAEAYFALEATARLAAIVDDGAAWEKYSREATALREAMLAKLFNHDSCAFVLNYDKDGNYQDNFTADEVFPVLFEVAEPNARKAILRRLSESDFTTPVGLRTISTADAWYFPSHGFGLLGGVWPDLTLWFAVALARNGAHQEAAHWLEAIYETMEAGAPRNTVPGQFGEWFDGGSLTNRGMYLSPWTGAKYLWAVAETVCGLDGYRTSGRPHIAPLLPPDWTWTAAVRVHWGGHRHSYVIDAERRIIVGDMDFASADEPYRVYFAGRDVSDEIRTSPVEVGAVAFEDAHGAVLIYVCNDRAAAREVVLEFRGETYRRRVEAGRMVEIRLGEPVLVDAMTVRDSGAREAAAPV
ncbi:MAG TPA: amylo-alpha-1,6-glucosidase [Candidatus Limnocylindrales bacterium]|nr:amylo-alpha-1,6-glucosidase [Candidatus Limnocylindrales bacterium]